MFDFAFIFGYFFQAHDYSRFDTIAQLQKRWIRFLHHIHFIVNVWILLVNVLLHGHASAMLVAETGLLSLLESAEMIRSCGTLGYNGEITE
jgi:hypothetical protein